MPPVTRGATAAANRTNRFEEPPMPVPKKKCILRQVKAAMKMATIGKQKAAIEEAAMLEAELHQARDRELQDALQVTKPAASGRVPTMIVGDAVNNHHPHSDAGEEEEEDEPKVGTPLVCQLNTLKNAC
jgi:hypothetical protein